MHSTGRAVTVMSMLGALQQQESSVYYLQCTIAPGVYNLCDEYIMHDNAQMSVKITCKQ
jgi:hypothetical protein